MPNFGCLCCYLSTFPDSEMQVPVQPFDHYLVALSGMSQAFIKGFGARDMVLRASSWLLIAMYFADLGCTQQASLFHTP